MGGWASVSRLYDGDEDENGDVVVVVGRWGRNLGRGILRCGATWFGEGNENEGLGMGDWGIGV